MKSRDIHHGVYMAPFGLSTIVMASQSNLEWHMNKYRTEKDESFLKGLLKRLEYLLPLEDKFFAKEVNEWKVDVSHKKMLYAVLKCAENGWGMKGFRQWYLYERLSKDAPSIVPMNVDFTVILCRNTLINLNGEMASVKINQ